MYDMFYRDPLNRIFIAFSLELLTKCYTTLQSDTGQIAIDFFQIPSNSFFTSHPVIPRYEAWATDKIVK
jgi:hypothetical protein